MSPAETREHLLAALRRALRPLSRLLIRAGMPFDEFARVAEGIYIESAIRDFDYSGVPSRMRIAVLSGLTSHQIDNYLDNGGILPESDPTLRSLLPEVLHIWHTSLDYSGPYGIPFELQFASPAGRCFRSLVERVDPTANPAIVLEELLRCGAIAHAPGKRLRAISRSLFLPDAMSPQLMEHYGERIGRLAETMEYNMNPKHAEKLLHRRVRADGGLPSEFVSTFENYVRSRAANFLSDMDNWIAARTKTHDDALNTDNWIDTGVNVFLYIEEPQRQVEQSQASLGV